MKKIEINGKTYKSKFSCIGDKIRILNFNFVLAGVITENEWAKSMQPINERFNLGMQETKIDGRRKENKPLPYFSWNILKR